MTDARGWTLLGLTILGWFLPQTSAEQWAVKSGLLTSGLTGLAAWSLWRGGRKDLMLPAAACACWAAATMLWSLDPVRSAGGALAIGSLLLIAGGGISISTKAALTVTGVIAGIEAGDALFRQSGLPRASGSFVNATHFAAAVSLFAAAGMPGVLAAGRRGRWIGLSLLALFVLAAGRSGSRAGVIALASGLIVAIISVRRFVAIRPRSVVLIVVAGLGALLIPAGLRDRMAAQVSGGEVSAWDRLAIWKTSLSLAARHPLGVGIGAFGDAFGPVTPRPGVTTDYAHSEPLQVLVETGWPGLLLLGWLVAALRRVIRVRDVFGAQAAAALAALGVFVLLDFPLHMPYLALAGSVLLVSLLPPPTPALRVRPLVGLMVAATAAAAMIWLGGLAVAEFSYSRGYRVFATNPPAAIAHWERAVAACPEYAPPRIALDVLRRDPRK